MQILGATFEFCAKFQIKTNSDWSKHSFPVFTLAHTKSKQIKRRQIWFGHLIFASSQNIIKNLIFNEYLNKYKKNIWYRIAECNWIFAILDYGFSKDYELMISPEIWTAIT